MDWDLGGGWGGGAFWSHIGSFSFLYTLLGFVFSQDGNLLIRLCTFSKNLSMRKEPNNSFVLFIKFNQLWPRFPLLPPHNPPRAVYTLLLLLPTYPYWTVVYVLFWGTSDLVLKIIVSLSTHNWNRKSGFSFRKFLLIFFSQYRFWFWKLDPLPFRLVLTNLRQNQWLISY